MEERDDSEARDREVVLMHDSTDAAKTMWRAAWTIAAAALMMVVAGNLLSRAAVSILEAIKKMEVKAGGA